MNVVLAFGFPLYNDYLDPKLSSSFRARLAEIDFPTPSFINTDFERYPFVGVILQIDPLPEHGFVNLEDVIITPAQSKALTDHMDSEQFPRDIAAALLCNFEAASLFLLFPDE